MKKEFKITLYSARKIKFDKIIKVLEDEIEELQTSISHAQKGEGKS